MTDAAKIYTLEDHVPFEHPYVLAICSTREVAELELQRNDQAKLVGATIVERELVTE